MPKIEKREYEMRVRVVQEWILEDWPSCDIIAQMFQKWGLEVRQAKRYIAEARKRWVGEDQTLVAHKRKLKVESLKKLKRSLGERYKGTPLGIHAIISIEKEIIKLEGLELAKKVELSGPQGRPIETTNKSDIDYSKLSDEVLEAIVNARITDFG